MSSSPYTKSQRAEHRKDVLAEFILHESPATSHDIHKKLPHLSTSSIAMHAQHLERESFLECVTKADWRTKTLGVWRVTSYGVDEAAKWGRL